MIASEAPWADVAQLLPSKVHYLVVANSALLKFNKDGGELLKTYRGNAQFAMCPGAYASDLAAVLNAYADKSVPTILLWSLAELIQTVGGARHVLPTIPDDFYAHFETLVHELHQTNRVIVQAGGPASQWEFPPVWGNHV